MQNDSGRVSVYTASSVICILHHLNSPFTQKDLPTIRLLRSTTLKLHLLHICTSVHKVCEHKTSRCFDAESSSPASSFLFTLYSVTPLCTCELGSKLSMDLCKIQFCLFTRSEEVYNFPFSDAPEVLRNFHGCLAIWCFTLNFPFINCDFLFVSLPQNALV